MNDDALEHAIKPGNRVISKHLILTKDSSGKRQDDVIEKLELVDTRGASKTLFRSDWDILNRRLKAEYQLESLDAGISFHDYLDEMAGPLIIDAEQSIMWKMQNITPTGTEKFEVLTKYYAGNTLVKAANA